MKTVRVPVRSKTLNDFLKKARDANVLLRSGSSDQFVLAKVSSVQSFYVGDSDDFDEEIKMTREQKADEVSGEAGRTGKKARTHSNGRSGKEIGA